MDGIEVLASLFFDVGLILDGRDVSAFFYIIFFGELVLNGIEVLVSLLFGAGLILDRSDVLVFCFFREGGFGLVSW